MQTAKESSQSDAAQGNLPTGDGSGQSDAVQRSLPTGDGSGQSDAVQGSLPTGDGSGQSDAVQGTRPRGTRPPVVAGKGLRIGAPKLNKNAFSSKMQGNVLVILMNMRGCGCIRG